jgi:acetyl esterase/lipase
MDNAEKYAIDPKRVAIWGFSSGGNLAAAVALRDANENTVPRIKHVNLVVPVTCHPALYPPMLSSNGASGSIFGASKEGQVSLSTMRKLWGKYGEQQI